MSDQPIYSSFPQDQCKDKTCQGDCDCDDSTGHVTTTEIFTVMPRQPLLPQNWTEESYGEKKEPTEAPSYYCDCGTRMYEVAFKAGRATMKCGACGYRMNVDAAKGNTQKDMDVEKKRTIDQAMIDAFGEAFKNLKTLQGKYGSKP